MKTEIDYLKQLGEDLKAVAEKDGWSRREVEPGGPRRSWSIPAGVAAAIAFLMVAGLIGFVVKNLGGGGGGNGSATSPQYAATAPRAAGRSAHLDQKLAAPSQVHGGVAGGPSPAPSPLAPGDRALGSVNVPPIGPSIIKTARLSVQVDKGKFAAQFQAAQIVADSNGGYVQESSTAGSKTQYGTLVIRIPATNFESALSDLRALGKVESESVSGKDVTAEFVDLAARLRNLQVQEARLRTFLQKATTVEGSLHVENALSDVELQIEQLTGEQRLLRNQTDLSTIQVQLAEPRSHRRHHHHHVSSGTSLGDAWHNAVEGFLGVTYTVIVGLGYLVPISILLLLVWLGVRRYRTRIPA